MIYPAVQLITRAWYLSGVVARDLETVSGDYISEGLFLLNTLLDFKASDLRLIPYVTRYDFNLVSGQEVYFIPDLYGIETMTFFIGDVRYPMTEASRDEYFGRGRVDNILSIPFTWHLERQKGGSNIYVYYLPLQNYRAQVTAQFSLANVTLNQDMSLLYDGFYMEYLRYALAQMMANEWDISFAPAKLKTLQIYEKKLQDISPPDLTMQKVSFLKNKTGLNWAQINIGRGFTT